MNTILENEKLKTNFRNTMETWKHSRKTSEHKLYPDQG